jgi:hypothetical protein
MLNKTIITLAAVLTLGAASVAQAEYQFDSSGAPIDMHIVDAQRGAFASVDAPVVQAQPRGSWSAAEQALFDRTSRPYHLGEEHFTRQVR